MDNEFLDVVLDENDVDGCNVVDEDCDTLIDNVLVSVLEDSITGFDVLLLSKTCTGDNGVVVSIEGIT